MSGEENEHPADESGNDNLNGKKVIGETVTMVAEIDKSLVALGTVRKPGKGKLSLGEAMATVIEQAEAYEQWCQFGSPVGMIDVWIETQKVMTVQPGDITELKGVLFELASQPKSVVQVVRRADEIVDTVILLNRELQQVSPKGVKFVQPHPNKQVITLEVKPEENGQLRLWLGFNPTGVCPVDDSRPLERLRRKAASVGTAFHRKLQLPKSPWTIPAFATVAFAMLAIAIGPLFFRRQADALGAVRPPPATKGVAAIMMVDSPICFNVDGLNKVDKVGVAIGMIIVTVGNQTGGDGTKKSQSIPQLKPMHVNVPFSKDEPLPEDSSTAAATLTGVPTQEENTAALSPWETQRLHRLAEVQSVFLLISDNTKLNKAQVKDLFASVRDALKMTGIAVVTDEARKNQADGIMRVRFEPDTIYFGAIFATIRDREGNFLWQEHASCGALSGGGSSAIFDDASKRLVSKLPLKSSISPPNVGVKEQAVARME